MPARRWRRVGKGTNPFYYSTPWRKKRVVILQRDHYMCQCHRLFGGRPCGRIATEVHHIRDLAEFPDLALSDNNLISLAWICHEKTKKKTQRQLPIGVRVIKM